MKSPIRLFEIRTGVLATFACLSAISGPLSAAEATSLQTFLKIDTIKGESSVEGHKSEIEALGFTSGVEVPLVETGAGVGKPQFFEINVSKNVDKSSPLLFVNCALGKRFPQATLTVAKVSASGATDYFKIVLSDVAITRVQSAGLDGSGRSLKEEVALSFRKILWSVTTPNPKGAPTVTTGGYDLAENVKL